MNNLRIHFRQARIVLALATALSGCAEHSSRGIAAPTPPAPKAEPASTRDFALALARKKWLHHPVIGDPSWDVFEREKRNPIHVGKAPFEWPVNGFLFRDPPSGTWFAFVSVYPRGYWGQPPANVLPLRENAAGQWEPLPLLFGKNNRPPFVGENGLMTDASVVYDQGRYHLIYGWADKNNGDGGVGYAWAEKPEGPYRVSQKPLDEQKRHQAAPILGVYVRSYASTLLKRKNDWLILHMMSTASNAGGTWGLFAMTAPRAEGPYSKPMPLLTPQMDEFHLPLAEFFPQFVHEGWVYAPASSVAMNRTFQSLFRAPLEQAHLPAAWKIAQLGSLWHLEPDPSEAKGIWGQTFSGQVHDGALRVLFTSKNAADIGTVGLARRDWKTSSRDGFVLSAPNAPAIAVLNGEIGDFVLDMKLQARGATDAGSWSLGWRCRGPLGADRTSADAIRNPLQGRDRCEFRSEGAAWSIVEVDAGGGNRVLARGATGTGLTARDSKIETLKIERRGATVSVRRNDALLWRGSSVTGNGRLELAAYGGNALWVSRFAVTGRFEKSWQARLASEAVMGAGAPSDWREAGDKEFRYATGFIATKPGARAKWNYTGSDFKLWLPRSPQFGKAEVVVDGKVLDRLDLYAAQAQTSRIVLQKTLPHGNHAVVLRAVEGLVPCDVLEIAVAP